MTAQAEEIHFIPTFPIYVVGIKDKGCGYITSPSDGIKKALATFTEVLHAERWRNECFPKWDVIEFTKDEFGQLLTRLQSEQPDLTHVCCDPKTPSEPHSRGVLFTITTILSWIYQQDVSP